MHGNIEARGYSLSRALSHLVEPADPALSDSANAERKASAALEARAGRASRGLSIPMARAINTGTETTGGALVGEDIGGFAEALRNASVLAMAGAKFLTGLAGRVSVSTVAAGSAASWVNEGAAPANGLIALATGPLRPSTVSAAVPFSRRLALQSTPDIEALL